MRTVLFTTPRPFTGHYAVIQSNALISWSLLNPQPTERVAFCDRDHEGPEAVAACESLFMKIYPVTKRSPRGVPFMSDMFRTAQNIAGPDGVACYTNADIILHDDLLPAIDKVAHQFPTFLAVSRRWNVQVLDPIDFAGYCWQAQLWEKIREQGSLMVECAIDLFAWRGNVFPTLADYAIGRYRWDNALIGYALDAGAPVIDISPVTRLVHQSHAVVPWEDPDATVNHAIPGRAGGLRNCTHMLTPAGITEGWKE